MEISGQIPVLSSDMIKSSVNILSVLSVEELVHDIEQYQGLRALRLEGNTVGVEAAQAIAKALESKDQLQVLLNSWFDLTSKLSWAS